jgi:hypothetical protein
VTDKQKSQAAAELGRKRWAKVGKKARAAHAKMMVTARELKRAQEKAQ